MKTLLMAWCCCGWMAGVGALMADGFADHSKQAVDALEKQLASGDQDWENWRQQSFASVALTREDAVQATALLTKAYHAKLREERAAEMDAQVLQWGDHSMRIHTQVFGELPEGGRSLYISMHGGGGAPARVNDGQWENQKKLYTPEEGVYVAPRAPTDTWNLWHQAHIDPLFQRLIQNMVVFHQVNPDRVYLMGYSAGGDGVYQLAPRMADAYAAAAMMAGHPNETSPLGLRNLPFSLFMGGKDAAYKRNQIAAEWKTKLEALRKEDPEGYEHWVKIFPDYGHWMQREDAVALPWMRNYHRQKYPERVVWKQDDVLHERFYWLHIPAEACEARSEVVVTLDQQTVTIEKADVSQLSFRFNDQMLDLDQPIRVQRDGKILFQGRVMRRLDTLIQTLLERGDPSYVFSGALNLPL